MGCTFATSEWPLSLVSILSRLSSISRLFQEFSSVSVSFPFLKLSSRHQSARRQVWRAAWGSRIDTMPRHGRPWTAPWWSPKNLRRSSTNVNNMGVFWGKNWILGIWLLFSGKISKVPVESRLSEGMVYVAVPTSSSRLWNTFATYIIIYLFYIYWYYIIYIYAYAYTTSMSKFRVYSLSMEAISAGWKWAFTQFGMVILDS